MIIALLCLDITRKHEKYSGKAVSTNKFKLQGLIRQAPSNRLLNKANKVNEEEHFPESTLKEGVEIDKNKVTVRKIPPCSGQCLKKLYKNILQLRQRSYGGLK